MRAIIVVVVLAMLAMPVQADWLQPGFDAARTGFTPEDGPHWPDIVYSFHLPGAGPTLWTQPEPVIVGDDAFVAGASADDAATLYRVHLPTGDWEIFAEPRAHLLTGEEVATRPAKQLVADEERLFAVHRSGWVTSWRLDDASPPWPPVSLYLPHQSEAYATDAPCTMGAMAVHGNGLYVTCNTGLHSFHVWRLETTTGALVWSYDWATGFRMGPDNPPANLDPNNPSVNSPRILTEARDQYYPTGLSVLGDTVFVTVQAVAASHVTTYNAGVGPTQLLQSMVVAMETDPGGETGSVRWAGTSNGNTAMTDAPNWIPAVTGDQNRLFIEFDHLLYSIPLVPGEGGSSMWTRNRPSPSEGDPASGLALAPEGLYATTLDQIQLVDRELAPIASHTLPPGLQWGRGAPVRTGNGLVIAPYGLVDGTSYAFLATNGGLMAMESRTLRPVWDVPGAVNCTFAVSDGLVVRWCADGRFQVLGRSEASIPVNVVTGSKYPAIGDIVRVDLGQSGTGAFGPPTAYRAVWGDGSETEWQESPIFEHRYVLPADAHARFFARNENQSSSEAVLFHVGTADPSVNIFNSPFADEYQEATFFFLGLILTGVVALVGIYRAGRKRRRLERELRELEVAYGELMHDIRPCERMLAERRARARALFLERKLEEAHASFLVTRVDELRHGLRINEVEQRLDFLPLGMVKALREILRDSKITQWERSQFLLALERDTLMSPKQKAKVLALIDTWFASDTAIRA